ncbi:MAG TPA: response regulator transcription factor [Actinocrinis sp.]|nr:response regulator transcription factor [Actinocrinis sp.]
MARAVVSAGVRYDQLRPRFAVHRRFDACRSALTGPAEPAASTIGLVAVDSHPIVLAGLRQLCAATHWLHLAAVAANGAEAIAAVGGNLPKLVVMDARLPDLSAIDVIRRLRTLHPPVRIVLFTTDPTRAEHTVAAAGDAGEAVAAVVHKRTDLSVLASALRRVADGERLLPDDSASGTGRSDRLRTPGALTPREHEILRKVAAGKTNIEIARELGLAHNTIKTYFQRTLEKLGARNRVEALLRADEKGLL